MALATRCPHCKTTFRVASDQLKLRGGIVRCGTCNQVFDGNATLVDLDAPQTIMGTPPAPEIPAWLARTPAPVAPPPAAPETPAPAAAPDDAPIPAWLARAMDAEVQVEPTVEIAFEPIVFKRDADVPAEPAPAHDAPPEDVTPEPAAAIEAAPPAVSQFELIIEPDLLTDAIGSGDTSRKVAPEPEVAAEPAAPAAPVPEPEPEPVAAPEPESEPAPVAQAARVLDFDLSQEPEPAPALAPVFDNAAFASPSAAVDMDFASFDDPLPMRLPQGYVLDYDLSDPEGWVADAPVVPAPVAPARAPAFEPGPDTELGPLYETEEETHYDLDLEQPPVDELLELSVADEVEFSSADANSQLPPVAEPQAQPEPEPASAAEPEPEPVAQSEPEPAAEPLAELESAPLLLRESAPPDDEPAEAAAPEVVAETLPEADPKADAVADADADADADEPEFVRLAREKELASRRRTIMLGAGTAVLALALLAQGVTTFRDVLAARYPALKPAMTSACALLGCKVELPAQLDALKIEAPELQSLGNNTFVLTTLLRNESGLAQAWPYIHLELTDANDKPLVRRVFTPQQYLPATVAPGKGFAATSEQPVKIHFELKQLKASGFHVAVFYP